MGRHILPLPDVSSFVLLSFASCFVQSRISPVRMQQIAIASSLKVKVLTLFGLNP